MSEIWICEHDDFPVYSIEGPPPAGLKHHFSQVAVTVPDATLAAWQEVILLYAEAQAEMRQAWEKAAEIQQPD